jgi:tRNA(fMet)-specific endonuclease VapC
MIILDTDHISRLQYRNSPQAFALQARLEALPPHDVATTIITVEEQLRGWLALIRRYTDVHRQVAYYDRLLSLLAFFAQWYIFPFDQPAAEVDGLRQQRMRIATMDLKIAAIALVHNATLLSGNVRDFQQVAGLHVEDWRHTAPQR